MYLYSMQYDARGRILVYEMCIATEKGRVVRLITGMRVIVEGTTQLSKCV